MKKTVFGPRAMLKKTPAWAIWTFRIYFYLSSVASIALTTFTSIPVETKIRIAEITAFSNMAMHLLAQMVGYDEGPVDENSYH